MTASQRERLRRRPSTRGGSPSSLAIEIEELVLNGFDPADRYRIGDAAQAELARLFERHDRAVSFDADVQLDRVNAGSFTVPAAARPEMTGVHIAGAIHRSVVDSAPRGSVTAAGRAVARQADDRPPPVERSVEVQPRVGWSNAYAVPECDAGKIYDPNWEPKGCRPLMCRDFDVEEARRVVMKKLSETSKYVPLLAAAIRRGRFARFFPAALEKELTAGAQTVVTKLRDGKITIVCTSTVSVAESDGSLVKLPVFPAVGSPPWSQTLMNNVSLHECLHLICWNLPSQPGKDPYENAKTIGGDPGTAMHPDLVPIMTAFPLHIPKW